MNDRPLSFLVRTSSAAVALALLLLVVVRLAGQGGGASTLTLLGRDGRRTMSIVAAGGQELVALDDLAAAFQLTVREEAGAITVSYKGRTIVLTPEQALASVAGRLVSLPAPPVRAGGRWMVPLEFISRALALVYDTRLELRRPSRLVVVGDLRVPRVTVRYEPLAGSTRLTLDVTPATPSSIGQEATRLSIRFEADALDVAVPAFQPQGLLLAIRSVDAATLALDLGPRFASFRTSTQAAGAAARLVIELLPAAAPPVVPTPPPTPPPVPPALPSFRPPVSAIRTIVIDPGHGGDDAGARGATGTLEKDLTLAVARRLKTAVEARLGIRVILTRDDDRDMPLDRRTALANNSKADVFLSLHANASVHAGAAGAAIFVAEFDGHDQATATASPVRVPLVGGGSRNIELLLWELAQTRYLDQSGELARLLAQEFENRLPLAQRPLGRAPFRVLESANMPAVLIEMGYLTNADQERLLAGSGFQTTFVQAVFDALVRFRIHLESAGGDR